MYSEDVNHVHINEELIDVGFFSPELHELQCHNVVESEFDLLIVSLLLLVRKTVAVY